MAFYNKARVQWFLFYIENVLYGGLLGELYKTLDEIGFLKAHEHDSYVLEFSNRDFFNNTQNYFFFKI